MNSVQIIGNLTRDPEVRYTKTGKPVASFTVAVNRSWGSVQGEKRESTDFIPVVAWGKLAELVGNRLKKGTRTFVEGRFQTRSYETQEGEKRYITEVVANLVAPNVDYDKQPSAAPEPRADYSQFGAQPQAGGNFGNQPSGQVFGGNGNDDDIPF